MSEILTLGVCDYPEHVAMRDWLTHAKQQKALGLSHVRLAEFSWAKIEPEDGRYDWEWLDQAIKIYQNEGLNIVLGTPTATPPAWLIQKYPEVLPVDENGQVKRFGSRRHYDHASNIYRQESARIVSAMVTRYGEHPAVIGWQTDNELGHEGTTCSYGGASAANFPHWLEKRYATLDALNEAWGTAFWSQTYTDWQQISPPNLTAVRQANPSHALDYQRFCSAMIEEFQQIQIDIIRQGAPGRFITHNFVIFSAESDLYALSENLDFVAWDSYPIGMLEYFATWESEETKTEFARTGHPDLVAFNHDLYRGLKSGRDFWVMEQQCGHANWAQYNPLPADGAVKLWTAQAWAHGAESVVYFRWRACHMAQEIMHSGLLRQDGSEDRGCLEVKQITPETFPLAKITNRVVLLHDYDSLWIYNQQPHHQQLTYWHQFMLFYSVCRQLGIDVDIRHPAQVAPGEYDVVIAPALTLVSDTTAETLNALADSAKIILGPRTGFRTASGRVPDEGQFANLRGLAGCRLSNFESLRPTLEQTVTGVDAHGSHSASYWCEAYQVEQGTALYHYENGPLHGQPAVVENGNVIVIGALGKTLIRQVLQGVFVGSGLTVQDMPQGVRISRRGDQTLLCNFNQYAIDWQGMEIPAVSSALFASPRT